MKPFFSFYGSKWRLAKKYPTPQCARIVEPFAGSAGYSTRYASLDVTLVERDPSIAALWRYLVGASRSEILALPLLAPDETVYDLDVNEEARLLIGFWLNKGNPVSCTKPSAWMRTGLYPNQFWGETIRERVASQVERINHWHVIEGSYEDAPMQHATWFIDPPYEAMGKYYRYGSEGIDYARLGEWCDSLPGQVIVCEQSGAEWLPFEHFSHAKGMEGMQRVGRSSEVIYHRSAA